MDGYSASFRTEGLGTETVLETLGSLGSLGLHTTNMQKAAI